MKIESFDKEYRWLSNFHPTHTITAEHIYQAMKTQDYKEQIAILFASTPGVAKRLGKKVALREDWDEIKVDVMRQVLECKFSNPDLQNKLLMTDGIELVEGNTWGDTFWGICNSKGKNMLGNLLMELRDKLREKFLF